MPSTESAPRRIAKASADAGRANAAIAGSRPIITIPADAITSVNPSPADEVEYPVDQRTETDNYRIKFWAEVQ
jgi:hypothetical protein